MTPPAKRRLDQELVARGLAPTRARARDVITRGLVRVGGRSISKPSLEVAPDAAIEVTPGSLDGVSRGAEKLAPALAHFGFEARGTIALDIGASTGGFTEILLKHGAARVYAVDIGHGQLHPRLTADPRVVSLEKTDARTLDARLIPDPIDALTADVSFISLTKALPAALALARPGTWALLLVKPQFEVGREHVGKGGIVRDPAARRRAVDTVAAWIIGQGWRMAGSMPSPITGGDGNEEALLAAIKPS